jgi:hypothetical protein
MILHTQKIQLNNGHSRDGTTMTFSATPTFSNENGHIQQFVNLFNLLTNATFTDIWRRIILEIASRIR